MVDYERIGRRIAEERKRFRKMTQEELADALGMYQADVSNLERARKGSGITDLTRLELIADYFEMPLENLIFGTGRGDRMEIYHGSKMSVNMIDGKGKLPAAHRKLLQIFIGKEADVTQLPRKECKCGPYTIYCYQEIQTMFSTITDENGEKKNGAFPMEKLHFYVLYDNEAIANMVVTVTSTIQHLHLDTFQCLQQLIQFHVFDPLDVRRHLNPYWMLYYLADDGEEEQYVEPMEQRFRKLHEIGPVPVLYIESAYVKEDCRQKGMLRLLIDCLKNIAPDSIMWLNMEPTSGVELSGEYDYYPSYTPSDLGQVNLNASIAEHLGFTIDPDLWHREAEVLDDDGNPYKKVVEIRKCAYYNPKKIRDILAEDGDLVALGRAKQKLKQSELNAQNPQRGSSRNTIDLNSSVVDGWYISEEVGPLGYKENDNQTVSFFAAHKPGTEDYKFGVARRSVITNGLDQDDMLECYDFLDDAMESQYFDEIFSMHAMVMSSTASLEGYDEDAENIEKEL